ncbi:hypothetical protein [Acidithiobacillus ferrooxidans]|uniref:hypothetical protein n=1 Tax=Acidithiobacillus ferrooxidans TaxID=920 RepID=UPI000A6BD354|nr:hypothetical protein [Acidithiobacillus ferrooxidans]
MKEDQTYLFPDALSRAMKLWKEDDEQRQSRRQPVAPSPTPATTQDGSGAKDDQEDDFEL